MDALLDAIHFWFIAGFFLVVLTLVVFLFMWVLGLTLCSIGALVRLGGLGAERWHASRDKRLTLDA